MITDSEHRTICDFIGRNIEPECRIFADWYDRIISSEFEFVTLEIPFYDTYLISNVWAYLRCLNILRLIEELPEHKPVTGDCLFNIFSNERLENVDQCKLNLVESKEDVDFWENGTLTDRIKFLPVFDNDFIQDRETIRAVRNTFELFKSIRKNISANISSPRLFSSSNSIILAFDDLRESGLKELIWEKRLDIKEKLSHDESADLEEDLLQLPISLNLTLRYPYSHRPHSYLRGIGTKRLILKFNSRFVHDSLLENKLIIHPRELHDEAVSPWKFDNYTVVNTNHGLTLYELLKSLKREWIELDLNRFQAPFPKYWLSFVNQGKPLEWWLNQFKIDYPSIQDRPIAIKIERIIEELHELNWVNEYMKISDPNFLFTEVPGQTQKRFKVVLEEFKVYAKEINPDIKFYGNIMDVDLPQSITLNVLSSFNLVDLSNIHCKRENISIVIPDFIFFSYQPWIAYHSMQFNWLPFMNEIREKIDEDYGQNRITYEAQKSNIVDGIKLQLNEYHKRYISQIEEEPSPIEIDNEEYDSENLNHEEEDISENVKSDTELETILLETDDGQEHHLKGSDLVFLRRNTINEIPANKIKKGDCILLKKNLRSIVIDDNILDRLSDIPDQVVSYQHELFERESCYENLKRRGISYQGENYFNKRYRIEKSQISSETFVVPRRKNDWKIICEYLGIEEGYMNLAFIAYYGRSKRNQLINLYRLTIEMFLKEGYFGMAENPLVHKQTLHIIEENEGVFSDSELDKDELANTIIDSLLNELIFQEVKSTKRIDYEQIS